MSLARTRSVTGSQHTKHSFTRTALGAAIGLALSANAFVGEDFHGLLVHPTHKFSHRFVRFQASIAAQHIQLMAADLQLATCWVGAFEQRMLQRALGVPEEMLPAAVITLGYPDEKVPVPPQPNLEDIIYFEKWGSRVKDWAAYAKMYSELMARFAKRSVDAVKNAAAKLRKK